MAAEWPLVGRAPEFERICRLLTRGRAGGVLLTGPAGVGKTRLALACVEYAEKAGLATTRVTATRAASGLPFGALASLLPPAPDELAQKDDRFNLLRKSAAALIDQAAGRRLVLFIDDAHLLDNTSAILIHQLASAEAVFILATLRADEPAPDPIVALWKSNVLETVTLGTMHRDAIEEALRSAVGGLVDSAAMDLFADRSQGNMLLLRELVHGAFDDGSLFEDGGIWRLRMPLSPSGRLVALVEERLSGLTDAERAVLEAVSLGEPLGPAELNTLADSAMIDRLERRRLLSSSRSDNRLQVRLAHPIYGEVLRSSIPGLRSREIARSLAEAVKATGARRREDLLRVASWSLQAGEGADPELVLAGATAARWRYDFPLAGRLAKAALAGGAGFDAGFLLAQLAILQGQHEEVESQLAHLATQAGDDDERGMVAIAHADYLLFHQGRIDHGLQILNEAEATITDPLWRDEVTAKRSGLILGRLGPAACVEALAPLLERAEGRALMWASTMGMVALARTGQTGAALETGARGRACAVLLAEPFDWDPIYHPFRCVVLSQSGRITEAVTELLVQHELRVAQRSTVDRAYLGWALCRSLLNQGRVATAARFAREVAALFRELGWTIEVHSSLTYLALALAYAAKADEAAEVLAALDGLGMEPHFYCGTDTLEARAWVAVANGDVPAARVVLAEAADVGESIGDMVGAATALHSLARLGQARSVTRRLAALAEHMEGELIQVRVAHTEALVNRDALRLDQASARFESIGADLLAAEAANDAAVAWHASGLLRDARAAERRARMLIDRCEGASTPALHAVAGRVYLSRSQQDVALLAARGRSNREIADQLHCSIRTVETYLQHVYSKLGISSRDQLACTLAPSLRESD
ncbi:MAG TPA: AAA family ATPase [Pseudonocardiaceae bacterium]|nr:AAA family ATPase [Pseudonocardiaceae bacterium]